MATGADDHIETLRGILGRILAGLASYRVSTPQRARPAPNDPVIEKQLEDSRAMLRYARAYDRGRDAGQPQLPLGRDGWTVLIGLYLTHRFGNFGFTDREYESLTGCKAARLGQAKKLPRRDELLERGRTRYLALAEQLWELCDDARVLQAIAGGLDREDR